METKTTEVGELGCEEPEKTRTTCCPKSKVFMTALMAMFSRLLFLLHGTIMLVDLVKLDGVTAYVILGVLYGLIVTEALVVLLIRKGHEWKWYSPSILFYLACLIPPLWMMEDSRQTLRTITTLEQLNQTTTHLGPKPQVMTFTWTWVQVQVMLVAIIISRWLMPKGSMTRDQLSSLLMLYLATASDIVDFFNLMEEVGASLRTKSSFHYLIAVWTWSMLQFPFVRTATRELYNAEDAEAANMAAVPDAFNKQRTDRCTTKLRRFVVWCFENETWSLLITIIFQDGPYLLFRTYLVLEYDNTTRTSIFFIVKNSLVLLLQAYRITALSVEHRQRKEEERVRQERQFLSGLSVTSRLRRLAGKHRASGKVASSFKYRDNAATTEVTTDQ